jgi:hypothetical protein
MTLTSPDAPYAVAQRPRRTVAEHLKGYIAYFDDGEILRWAFRGMLIGTVTVLAMDLMDLSSHAPEPAASPVQTAMPILPPAIPDGEPASQNDPRKFIKTDQAALLRPMQFTLTGGGVLKAEGSIEPGTAAKFATELQARGEYVKMVSLNSPGGALEDAMEMARQVRLRGIATEVEDGALCASSCPLLFAGGKKRLAAEQSAIGVHQFYAVLSADQAAPQAAQAMSDAQLTTARITRHLTEMGIDPAAWLHALDTSPHALYYFSPAELKSYRLVTAGGASG